MTAKRCQSEDVRYEGLYKRGDGFLTLIKDAIAHVLDGIQLLRA